MEVILEESENESGQDYFSVMGEKIIDKDVQTKLREIIKCAVCFEIPKPTKNLKIRTCEQGHHFCSSCYKNLKHCAICRGPFHLGRNFVVEELITQLGSSLGLTKINLPPPDETPMLVPGVFQCLHKCSYQGRAGCMLNHIRAKHGQNLVDNLRSNPYWKRFDWMFEIAFTSKRQYVLSVQVSDMGLFTVIINFSDDYLIGTVHMLASSAVTSIFQYKLTVKINKTVCNYEFSISSCDVLGYSYDLNSITTSGKCLKIEQTKLFELINLGEKMQIFFSICRRKEGTQNAKDDFDPQTIFPDVLVIFHSDRNLRRNRQRNLRRKKLKERRYSEDCLLSEFLALHLK